MQGRPRPSSAPGAKGARRRRSVEEDRPEVPRKVQFVEAAAYRPSGSAHLAARFARQQCQKRLAVATTLRRGERLSPRRSYRPSSAQVDFQRTATGNLKVVYPATSEVLTLVRTADREEEVEDEEDPEQASEAEKEESVAETSTGDRVQDLDDHVRNIWFMYQEHEEAADEKDKALLLALRGPAEEDREAALLNEMKLLKTGEDAIAFFAKHGDQSDLQVIHCVAAKVEEGKFQPYDLVVVDEKEKGSEYFMISSKGIVHVCPGKQSEHTTLTSWMHQVMMHTVLVSMSFFRNFLTGRAFTRWRSGASNQIYLKHRQSISRRLFLAKPTFVEAVVRIHGLLRTWSFIRLLALEGRESHGPTQPLELKPFLVQQRELCERVDLEVTAESAREVLDETIKKVMASLDSTDAEERLLKARNGSIFAKRQALERKAYRERLCAFNRSIVGSFVRLVDVMQQSCLVDVAVSKTFSLLERFAKTSKLFVVSPRLETAAGVAFEPGKKEFQEGMQQVIDQIVALCKVPNVVTYRKYHRHFKQEVQAASSMEVISKSHAHRDVSERLLQQIAADFEKAQQFCESHFAVVYQIHQHSLNWDAEAFKEARHSHESLAAGLNEMEVFEKHLQKLRTKHLAGFLVVEVTALRDSMVRHVKVSTKAMQLQLSALALETCKQAAARYHEVNQKLQERPLSLEPLVEYVRHFKRIEADLPELEALKASVEEMYGTLAQHNIRVAPGDDFQRDLMEQRAALFESSVMPGAQFFVNEQEENACTEVASRYSAAEQEVEDLQDEILAGMASDPNFLPEAHQVLDYLNEVDTKLKGFEKTFKHLNDCFLLFMQQPQDTDQLEEARELWRQRSQLWAIAGRWLETTKQISSLSLVALDISEVRCQLQGFIQVLGVLSMDLATDPVVLELLDMVDAWFAQRVLVWAQMTGPGMGIQHWFQVLGSFSDAESLLVSQLDFILSGIAAEKGRKSLLAATKRASQEHSLACTVSGILEAWEHVEMRLLEPPNAEAPWLLQSPEPILELLYEDRTALEQVLKSPHCDAGVEEFLARLSHACEVLLEFQELQEKYRLVEPLFRRRVLAEEEAPARVVERFSASDEVWRLLMHRAQTTYKTVLQFTGQSTMPKQLRRLWEGVNLAYEATEKLLDERRRQAPRLWFLSDPELMEVLSSAQNLSRGAPMVSAAQELLPRADTAAGKALAACAGRLFPWAHEARGWLSGDQVKVRRRSEASELIREEVDRALVSYGASATVERAVESPSETCEELVQVHGGHKERRISTELKSDLLGSWPVKSRGLFQGVKQGLSKMVEDVSAMRLEEMHQADSEMPWKRCFALVVEGEEMTFSWPASGRRGTLLCTWLLGAEKTMQQTLQRQIKEALAQIGDSSMLEVVCKWLADSDAMCGQAVLTASELYFVGSLETGLDMEDEAGVALVFGQVDEILESLQAVPRLVRVPSLAFKQRRMLSSLWLQVLQWQNQLEALKRAWNGSKTRDSLTWKGFLRRRWEGFVRVTCLDWDMPYGFEYVGPSARLVPTPETDRGFLALAAALREGHVVALAGAGECGKAQLVAELAGTAAVPLVTAAVRSSVDIWRYLAGVVSSNAWSFLRCEGLEKKAALMETLAEGVRRVMCAAREASEDLLELGPYKVRWTTGSKAFFLVMPQMPPEQLAELRPIALARPMTHRILTVLLHLEGFEAEDADPLAKLLSEHALELLGASAAPQAAGLRRLRAAVSAACEAQRQGRKGTELWLRAMSALVPGEGSLYRRRFLGSNAVLEVQNELLNRFVPEPSELVEEDSEEIERMARNVEAYCSDLGLSAGQKQPGQMARVAAAAVEIYEHLIRHQATVLVGPACSGKSVVVKAMQAVGVGPRLWYVYPQALVEHEGGDEMMSSLVRTVEGAAETLNIMVVDDEVEEAWMDAIWPLLTSSRRFELLFESRSLASSSPGFCARCAVCPLQDMLKVGDLLEACRGRLEAGMAGKAARLHSATLTAWLYRLAGDMKGLEELDEMVAADQLLHLLEATWRTVLPLNELEAADGEEDEELEESQIGLLEVWSVYCTAWVLGGRLDSRSRKRLGTWLIKSLEGANGLARGFSVLGHQVHVDPESLWKFRIASNAAALAGQQDVLAETTVKMLWEVLPDPEDLAVNEIFMPTEENEALRLFVAHQVHVECHFGFRLSGPQSGKSAFGEEIVRMQSGHLLRCPHRLSAAGFSSFIQRTMPRKGWRTWGSVSKSCIVVDDVHLASSGMRDGLRQALDRGHLTTEAGTGQLDGLCLGAIERHGGRGERWERHFIALHHPDLTGRSLRDVCTRLCQRWTVQVTSEDARAHLVNFPDRVGKVIQQVAAISQPFCRCAYRDVTRWFQSLEGHITTTSSSLQLQVWHEAMRQFGDRLQGHEERLELRRILEDAAMGLPCDTEDPVYLENGGLVDLENMVDAESSIKRSLAGMVNSSGMPMVFFEELIVALLSTCRALHSATVWEAAGAMLLGAPGCGRRSCATMAVQLAQGRLQRSVATEVAGLLEELEAFQSCGGEGLQCFGPITEELLMLPEGEHVLEAVDDVLRGATGLKVQKVKKEDKDASPKALSSRGRKRLVRTDLVELVPKGEKSEKASRLAFLICLDPTQADWFHRQLERYPALGSQVGAVWMHPWPARALHEVAEVSPSAGSGEEHLSM